MLKRALILLIAAGWLIVGGAEAMSGHCAHTTPPSAEDAMSHHCAEMMQGAPPEETENHGDLEATPCCCVVMSAPVMLQAPALGSKMPYHMVWQRPANSSASSIPSKVAIPPPRI